MLQSDLFGEATPLALPIPSLDLARDMVTPGEEAALIAAIEHEKLALFQFQQWEGKRLTRSFGWPYDFTSDRMAEAAPLPGWRLPLRDRAAVFAGLASTDLVQALLILYDPGAGIGWHKDRPVFEHVIGISLGNPATLRLPRRTLAGFDRAKPELATRSIYHLKGEVRHGWEHSIAPMGMPRWSITFRILATR